MCQTLYEWMNKYIYPQVQLNITILDPQDHNQFTVRLKEMNDT